VAVNDRWAISIDIEGFSKHYECNEERKTYAILALGELMNSVFLVGSRCFPGTPESNFSERLFAHQYGDGFLVCSDFPEADPMRAIAIAVAIMRHMIINGYATKAAISAGELSDIKGCYPKPVRDAQDDRLDLGMGLMTTISVMGTALTKAHKLATTRRGAVLILDERLLDSGLPGGIRFRDLSSNCIDWVCSELPLADEIATKSLLRTATAKELCEKLRAYCTIQPTPPDSWIEATFASVGCDGAYQAYPAAGGGGRSPL
jgi:hypothetical protein